MAKFASRRQSVAGPSSGIAEHPHIAGHLRVVHLWAAAASYRVVVFPPLRFLSDRQRALMIVVPGVCLLIVIGIGDAAQSSPQGPLTPSLTTIAALLALGSLVVSAAVGYANWSRSKKQATLTAWAEWFDSSFRDRRAFTAVFGQTGGLTKEQGEALVDAQPLIVGTTTYPPEEVKKLRRRVQKVLRGLERLAIGVEHQVYDADLIMEVGGTLVVGTFQRYKAYVKYLQTHPVPTRQHARAYVALEGLVADVEAADHRRKYYDAARVARIKTSAGRTGSSAVNRA